MTNRLLRAKHCISDVGGGRTQGINCIQEPASYVCTDKASCLWLNSDIAVFADLTFHCSEYILYTRVKIRLISYQSSSFSVTIRVKVY